MCLNVLNERGCAKLNSSFNLSNRPSDGAYLVRFHGERKVNGVMMPLDVTTVFEVCGVQRSMALVLLCCHTNLGVFLDDAAACHNVYMLVAAL